MNGARILVVDDEPAIVRAVRSTLERHGYRVDAASNVAEALGALAQRPDVILLDLGLPDQDGLALIERVRTASTTPILVLSARGSERDKVEALNLGADDYVTKPFGMEELLARVRVALRRQAGTAAGTVVRIGPLEVDLERRRVVADGRQVHLTPTEYDLLKAFVAAPGKVLTERMLLNQVWGPGYGADAHYLHVYMARLRKKLAVGGRRLFVNEPGVGYRLLDPSA